MRSGVWLALLLAAVMSCLAQAARAQQGLVSNPVIVGDYYENTVTYSSTTGNAFSLNVNLRMGVLPVQSRPYNLRITELGCNFDSDTMFVDRVWLTVSDNGANQRRPHPVSAPLRQGSVSFREPVNFLIVSSPSRTPHINMVLKSISGTNASLTFALDCTLVGTILPQ